MPCDMLSANGTCLCGTPQPDCLWFYRDDLNIFINGKEAQGRTFSTTTPRDLSRIPSDFGQGKEHIPMNEKPIEARDIRGNHIPRPAYEGWAPNGGHEYSGWWLAALAVLAISAAIWGLGL